MPLFGGKKRKQRLEEAGVNAQAVLVTVRDTGVTVNNNPRIVLTFQVTAADGTGPFEVQTKKTVSRVTIPRAGDAFMVRYDPEDHDNFELLGAVSSGDAGGSQVSLDSASASDISAAVQATGGGEVQRGSAAEMLVSGQRMTAVLREFSSSGRTVGESNPTAPDPNDPVYVIKAELLIEGASPIEAVFMHRVPEDKVESLRLGAQLDVAVNPANPTREVAIDWANSPIVG
jgi:hypothetical protein